MLWSADLPGAPLVPIAKEHMIDIAPWAGGVVDTSGIDYEAIFQALPSAVALFTTNLVYIDVNEACLSSLGTRGQVVGRYLFDAFPDDPKDPAVTGMRKLQASQRWVAATGKRDAMTLHRYDVEHPDRPGVWEERYWSPVNVRSKTTRRARFQRADCSSDTSRPSQSAATRRYRPRDLVVIGVGETDTSLGDRTLDQLAWDPPGTFLGLPAASTGMTVGCRTS
ncbi:hypothetical protein GCM10010207_75000 [Streptomyces atratus]|nr:hypothetical protein GCM10010207_75000 [Streptomyces atratus]